MTTVRDGLVLALAAALLLAAPGASGQETKKADKPKLQSVTGAVKTVDADGGTIVITRRAKTGSTDVTFALAKSVKVFWSKTKMKVTLADINPGMKVIIQFYRAGEKLVATKVVLPGGMKEAADAILKGKVKGGDKK